MSELDFTHDPKRRSWVESANGHLEFPIQNLPFGAFSPPGGGKRVGVAIGDEIFDVAAGVGAGLFAGAAHEAGSAACADTLNALMALPPEPRNALRQRLSDLLDANGQERASLEQRKDKLLHKSAGCTMHVPARIGDYTDFYAGIHHAHNAGSLFRNPQDALTPNYKHVPIGYHGRSSTIRVSGESVRRPNGQRPPASPGEYPTFGPSQKLDYELELGVWIGAGNGIGESISIGEAARHIVGLCLLNDWSARDIQGWESQPLGPFLAKNFSTTISPWVVTAEALLPFRVRQAPRPPADPQPLPYLWSEADQMQGALDCTIEAFISTPPLMAGGMAPHRLSRANVTDLYWTFAQLVAHHTSGGCALNPGDLLGSGTISGAQDESAGALLELSQNGRRAVSLPSGETRSFLENGDEVIFRAHCHRDGHVSIGFGECRGRVVA